VESGRGARNAQLFHQAEVLGGELSVASFRQFVFDLLSLVQGGQIGLFNRGNVHEGILGAVLRGDESVAFLGVEPFNSAYGHASLLRNVGQQRRYPLPIQARAEPVFQTNSKGGQGAPWQRAEMQPTYWK